MGEIKKENIREGVFKLTGKVISIVIGIIVLLGLTIVLLVLNNMKDLSRELTKDKLQALAYAVESHYDGISDMSYKIGSEGDLYKGTTNLRYEKDYINNLRDEMGAYTVLFFEGKALLTSFDDKNVDLEEYLTVDGKIQECVEKNGYCFCDDLTIGDTAYYAYYIVYSHTESGDANGIMVSFVDKEETWDFTKSILTSVVSTMIVAIIVAVIIISIFVRIIVKVIRKSVVSMDSVSKGYLNFDVPEKIVKRHDEIGDIAKGIQQVITNFKVVVTKIFEASEKLSAFTEDYSKSFNKIAETVKSVNVAVDEIANGATAQANETMSANTEMTNMGIAIDEASSNVVNLSDSSKKMTGYSNQARNTLEELSAINDKTMKSVDVVQNQTNLTNKSAMEIRQATELISDIASQTNLLSLNASIEAARAGENGRGFAVVADQIRNLAEQSKSSADQIASVVEHLIENSNESVDTMNNVMGIISVQNNKLDDTKEMFESLNKEIEGVNTAIRGIESEMESLNTLKETVLIILGNLAAVAEQNAASTQESSAAMVELADIIEKCNEDTGELVCLTEEFDSTISIFKL